jgi:hypothetical protein
MNSTIALSKAEVTPTRGPKVVPSRLPLSINGYASDLGEVQQVNARLDVTRTTDAVVARVGADDRPHSAFPLVKLVGAAGFEPATARV